MLAYFLLGGLLSWCLTFGVRRYALHTRLLDVPNARSSHSVPTPRGGGLAIVVTFALLSLGLPLLLPMPANLLVAMLPAALLVAGVGWLDDRNALPARARFAAHAAAGGFALWSMNGIPPVPMFGHDVDLGWFGIALATTYVVWMTNLYNFMDGIDGIASVEAIAVLCGGALCWWLADGGVAWTVPVLLACCVAGFLGWNYPPARIFMGDAGSGFIGVSIAVLSLASAQQSTRVFWCWFILTGCFMVDATTTLVRRVRRGERFHEAHRSHAYQYAARIHGAHLPVTLAVGAINLFWLLPLAVLVALSGMDGLLASIVAYAPLVWLAFRYKAGDRRAQEI